MLDVESLRWRRASPRFDYRGDQSLFAPKPLSLDRDLHREFLPAEPGEWVKRGM